MQRIPWFLRTGGLLAAFVVTAGPSVVNAQETADETSAPAPQEGSEPQEGDAPNRIPADDEVAFWLEQTELIEGEEAPPPKPITLAEWNKYVEFLRGVYPVADEPGFLYRVFGQLLDTYAIQMHYHKNVPEVKKKAKAAMRKLSNGTDWNRVVRLYSEDVNAPEDGLYGGVRHDFSIRYPLEMELFSADENETYLGPFYTTYGAEIFRINSRRGKPGGIGEQVIVSYVLIKWGRGLGKNQWDKLRRGLRVRTDRPEFARMLPPGMQVSPPKSFGPEDIAPVGEPMKQLTQYSTDERFHGKTPQAVRRQAKPVGPIRDG